ncbi:ABC transporter permease [Methylocapsa palsarum]|uniref:Oligopeptide transport system permease protein n=1 Tax=Methylocapsa palsarum TaxID=1612308 RepID=A0A1I3XLA1_9HYPH|nr:ABC transporter permease subunit [Methylocapsa palsarum]SFK19821.1 oligopeptide transport system permease protein [Methylocapsa palsarum]
MDKVLALFRSARRAPLSVRVSLTILSLIAILSICGPMASVHPYDRVYRDYVLSPPSMKPHPTAAEANRALEDIAQRMRLHVETIDSRDGNIRAAFSSAQPIDPRALRAFERSDVFSVSRLVDASDEGRLLLLDLNLKREVFLFGTDVNGRDLLTRVLIAGRVSLSVGLLASFVALFVGVAYGAIAGYAGGWVDDLMMRAIEIVYALPFIFFVIVLVMLFGRHFALIFVAIGAVEWLDMARIVRGQTLSIKRRDYVGAAEALGANAPAIIWRHVLPNVAGPVIAYLALLAPRVILLESFVSFLGFGVQEPLTSWGVLIADGARNIQGAVHLLILPALFLGTTLAALQTLGDSWRHSFDSDGARADGALYKL